MMAEKVINSPRARVRGLDVDGSINTGNSSPLRPRGREGEKMLCSWREACKAADYVLGGYRVSNCKFHAEFSGHCLRVSNSILARQRREEIARRMRGCGGEGGREGKPSPGHGRYAAFFRPTLAFCFVDSGSGIGVKLGSLAILFSSDSSLRMVGTIAHLCGWPSARFLW